ncbi:hypothetical protein [Methylobacterium crusticola]|uniref:hypothetical protein n=1 Tax=Methylobacterium crusticola TaxID=1697972 RepID=UPI000FFC5589|nr:hypothetical protein [Methylobacterium crusticola]
MSVRPGRGRPFRRRADGAPGGAPRSGLSDALDRTPYEQASQVFVGLSTRESLVAAAYRCVEALVARCGTAWRVGHHSPAA